MPSNPHSDPAYIDPVLQPDEYASLLKLRSQLQLKMLQARRAGIPIWGKPKVKPLDLAQVLLGLRPNQVAAAAGTTVARVKRIISGNISPTFLEGVRLAKALDRDPLQLAEFLANRRASRARRKPMSKASRKILSDFMRQAQAVVGASELREVVAQMTRELLASTTKDSLTRSRPVQSDEPAAALPQAPSLTTQPEVLRAEPGTTEDGPSFE